MAKPSDLITVDFEGVESGGGAGVHIPEGDYGFKVVKVVHKNAETSGNPTLYFTLKVTKGNSNGLNKELRHTCSLTKQALWNLRNLLEACGKTVPSKAVKMDIKKFVGLECAGTVVDDEYNGKTKSIVSAFFPISDLVASPSVEKKANKKVKEEEETEEEETEPAEEEEEAGEEEEEELFN